MTERAEITDEFIQKRIMTGRQYCVRLYKVGPNRSQPQDEVEGIQKEHLRYLWQLRAEGKLLISGPVMDDSDLQGVGIFQSTDKEEVKKLCEGDPAVKAGRLVYEIYSWFGLPGDSLPE
ncbi:MAG TPA: YciI family protein [Anaerolineales bacterium]|nr:YciI family protein [Anaerolineales bacterium]HMZ43931.1 YciI family protein [Anaerolineales bacterium]HNA55252.1 YciI family protein [Anaerolineales bacterium]HNB87539.1 YciI family protein [Anaerolineales bacterium]HNC89885.1 YciI family protein [Anaerolineales bacterium]